MKLGQVAKDRISGFEGVLTSRTEYLTGCTRWGLSPRALHEGKTIDPHYFDEAQLVVQDDGVLAMSKGQPDGGPAPAPQRASDPR